MTATILDTDGKIKPTGMRRILENRDLFPAVLIVVVGVVSFGLGRLSVEPGTDVPTSRLSSATDEAQASTLLVPESTAAGSPKQGVEEEGKRDMLPTGTATSASGSYVASKNSNKYHLPWCSGAARITEENKIWFSSKAEAEAAGYTPAGNCKGI